MMSEQSSELWEGACHGKLRREKCSTVGKASAKTLVWKGAWHTTWGSWQGWNERTAHVGPHRSWAGLCNHSNGMGEPMEMTVSRRMVRSNIIFVIPISWMKDDLLEATEEAGRLLGPHWASKWTMMRPESRWWEGGAKWSDLELGGTADQTCRQMGCRV